MNDDIPLPSDEREEQLPSWAKTLLRQLRREVGIRDTVIANLRAAFVAVGEGPEDSDTFIDAPDAASMTGRTVRLGRGTEVRFVPRTGTPVDAERWITVHVTDEGKVVADCGARLVIIPRVTYSVELRVDQG